MHAELARSLTRNYRRLLETANLELRLETDASPESIGALAVFLASDAAATITGASYSIDGGWTAQ